MNDFIIDTNEPKNVFTYLKPVLDNITIQPLNSEGYADYRWRACDGTRIIQVERKTWGELLADTDKVEEQLHRHLSKHPSVELVFLLEGLVERNSNGGTRVLNKQRNGFVTKGREYRTNLTGIYSWLYEIEKYCHVMQTPSLEESITALAALYKADQKEHHRTFRRHIKQLEFHPDPRVTTLMGISSGIGEARAQSLIKKFISPWNIMSAGYCEHSVVKDKYELATIPGIGRTIVDNMLRGFGRPDA